MRTRRRAAAIAAILIVLAAVAVALTPMIFAELFMASGRLHISVTPAPADPAAFEARPGRAAGQVVDGYWRVQQIGPATWAIGEPQNEPDNYEYLLVGQTGALLIDAGSTRRDIRPVLARLTSLPVTVIPTHLHFDHTNGLVNFTRSR